MVGVVLRVGVAEVGTGLVGVAVVVAVVGVVIHQDTKIDYSTAGIKSNNKIKFPRPKSDRYKPILVIF